MSKIGKNLKKIFKPRYSKEAYQVVAAMMAMQEFTRVTIEDLKGKALREEMDVKESEELQAIFHSAYTQIMNFNSNSEDDCAAFVVTVRKFCEDPFEYIHTSLNSSSISPLGNSEISSN